MRVEDLLTEFLIQLEADGRSPHTIRQYERHLRTLAAWAREVGHTGVLAEISHADIAAFLVSTRAKTRPDGRAKKAASRNALRASLRGFFRYAYQAGHLAEDPTRLLRRARCGSPPPTTLSDEDQRRLQFALANAEGVEARRDSALFDLMLRAGLRVGSIVALEVEDVDLERAELFLRRTKGDRPTRVIIPRAVRDHLRRYLGERRTGALFPGRGGQRLTTRHVQRRLAHWLREAGVERTASPHSLRHSFASNLYRTTGDVFLVKEALGHRSITSTLLYVRTDEERLREALG